MPILRASRTFRRVAWMSFAKPSMSGWPRSWRPPRTPSRRSILGCVLLDGFPAWVVVLHVSRGVVTLAIRTSERVLHTGFFCPPACGRGGAHGSAGQGRDGQTQAALAAGETPEGGPAYARRPC